jgi:hypothetical protein
MVWSWVIVSRDIFLHFEVGGSLGTNSVLHDASRLEYGRHVPCVSLNVLRF